MHPIKIQWGIDTLARARGILTRNSSTTWTGLCLAIALALFLPVSVSAGAVSGRVYGPDNKLVKNTTFTATSAQGRAVEFSTDASGNFSVYLDSGRYTVKSEADPALQGQIDSYPQPVQQDIHLQRR
jgi:hypothetical protein